MDETKADVWSIDAVVRNWLEIFSKQLNGSKFLRFRRTIMNSMNTNCAKNVKSGKPNDVKKSIISKM